MAREALDITKYFHYSFLSTETVKDLRCVRGKRKSETKEEQTAAIKGKKAKKKKTGCKKSCPQSTHGHSGFEKGRNSNQTLRSHSLHANPDGDMHTNAICPTNQNIQTSGNSEIMDFKNSQIPEFRNNSGPCLATRNHKQLRRSIRTTFQSTM